MTSSIMISVQIDKLKIQHSNLIRVIIQFRSLTGFKAIGDENKSVILVRILSRMLLADSLFVSQVPYLFIYSMYAEPI